MRLMGLMAIYQKSNTIRPKKGHKTYPYLLKGLRVDRPNQVWYSDKQMAKAAFALVFEKHCAGEVFSPGGYLRAMVEKAGAGELHLEQSCYGRLSRQAA